MAALQSGSITVTGLTVSETYRIGFVMARRGNYNAHLGRTFTLTMGGQNLGVCSPMTTTWEQALTAAVVANATSLQLVIEAGAEPGNDSMALIDDVAVMPAHPHAARAMGNGNSFEYDANGNMTIRRELSGTETFVYTQSWSIDNRLIGVTKATVTGTVLAVTTYAYDGDGARVRKEDPDGTVLYVGATEAVIGAAGTATAEYFDDVSGTTLSSFYAARSVTVEAGLTRTFTDTPPLAGMGDAPWAVRWQLWLTVPVAGTYTFAVYSDDGFSFNGIGLLFSNGTTRAATTTEASSGLVMTPGNVYNFALAYFNYTTATVGNIQLLWRRSGGALEVVPREAIHARGRKDYYSFGGAVVAMKEGVMSSATRTLTYLHGDHLGSVSLTTNATGQKVSEQRYKPYGEVRWSSGAGMPTDFTFTSQRAGPAGYVGSLMDYVARGYSPALGRFISADTIVPGAGNPAAFNRYMYVRGNPLRYVDPSGHMDASPDDNGATPGINDWPCGIENDCQMDWNNNAASRFGAGVLDEIGDALKGFFGLASAAANPASVIAAGFRAGSDFGANVASNGWESAISGALDDNPFIGAMRRGDYAYAGGRFIGFVSMAGLAGEFAPKGVCSFSPDTPVATEAGPIPIAGVITGTRVLAWDETANATGYYPVTNVWVHWDPVLVVLVIDGETITTTPEHPFYTPMHGWLPAGELWVGAGLRRADGGAAIVESTMTVTRTELMWNLTVDVVHTFFVGGGEWLAHNTCGVTSRIRDLQAAGVKDAHHVVQDAAVRDLPGYESLQAPGVSLSGPSTQAGTPHYLATMVQRQAGGGSLGAELRIGYKALRVAGYAEETARRAISEASDWFRGIGATSTTVTRIPGNR